MTDDGPDEVTGQVRRPRRRRLVVSLGVERHRAIAPTEDLAGRPTAVTPGRLHRRPAHLHRRDLHVRR
ncbi:hypothetical protein [Actinomycetospora cinnamomea]|uniref:hypothetical protein n=1 Tax=Actinomycetospora cinnamomea TaxID=663609 RepID=UPI000E321ED5|nr:hypothetical protein [Actinomycetospora cinnamomea]